MKQRKEFLGLDGFYWWFGVVESRQDPKGLGRCQVRIYGAHTDSLSDIPSADLPWAHPINSLNTPMFSTPKEGDYVFGFFLDGKFAQQPIMMGVMPTIPLEVPTADFGFGDIRTEEQLKNSPKKPDGIDYGDNDGIGASIIERKGGFGTLRYPYESLSPSGSYPTNSDLARHERIARSFIQRRRDSLNAQINGAFGTSWGEPYPAYNAKYPYNRVMETESGHIQEFDDTPGAERIHTAHRSGTFEEIYPSGTKVEKIVKNNYKIVLCDDHVYIAGRVNIVVDSDADIRVEGNLRVEGRGNMTFGVAGDVNFACGGDFRLSSKSFYVDTEYDTNIKAAGSLRLGTEAGLHLSTQKLNLSSDNDLNIVADGTLNLVGGDVKITSTTTVGVIAPLNFDVMSPTANFGVNGVGVLNASSTSMVAYGIDSNGDSHYLQVGMGITTAFVDSFDYLKSYTYPPSKSYLNEAPTFGDPNNAPPFIEPTPTDSAGFFVDSGEDPKEAQQHIQKQLDNGLYDQTQLDEGKAKADAAVQAANDEQTVKEAKDEGILLKDPNPNPKDNKSVKLPVVSDCGGIEKKADSEFVDSLKLSKYFSLGDLTTKAAATPHSVIPQRGLTKGQIVCNLKLLAVNCLDPIKEKYRSMIVTSGFRHPGEGESVSNSQHEIGQAADIQISGISDDQYFDVALWIKDNVPYDQLILEYKSTGNKKPWIHISFNKAGNRPATAANKVMTMLDHGAGKTEHTLINLATNFRSASKTPKKTKTETTNFATGNKEIVETTETPRETVIVKTSTDPLSGKEKVETTTVTKDPKNGGEIETIITQKKNDAGEVVEQFTSFKKQITEDPSKISGLINQKFDEATAGISKDRGNVAAALVQTLAEPYIAKIEQYGKTANNMVTMIEEANAKLTKAACELDKDLHELPGKTRREWKRAKDDLKKFFKNKEQAENENLEKKGWLSKTIKKASDEIHEEWEKDKKALEEKIENIDQGIRDFIKKEREGLRLAFKNFRDRLHEVYHKLVQERAEKNKKLKDELKTKPRNKC